MRVVVGPMKEGQGMEPSLRFLRSLRARFYSLTEMDLGRKTYLPLVYKVFGQRVKIYSQDLGEHSQEIPIVLRPAPWVRVKKFELHKLSNDVPGRGLGNDRWLAELHFRFFTKTYVLFATHTNAGVQRIQGDGSIVHGPRWVAFCEEIDKIEAHVQKAISDPSISGVILQGDFNMMPFGEGRTDQHSPHQLFKRLHMEYTNSRVVYIAAWGMTFNKVEVYRPGTKEWLSDHAAIFASLKRNKKAYRPKF